MNPKLTLSRRRPARPLSAQRGVTLLVAMIMLVVIGLASVALMRNSLGTDTVANNSRVQTLANQAAQIALRYCEEQLQLAPADRDKAFNLQAAADPHAWESFDSWHGGTATAMTVPEARMKSDTSTFVPATLPQCLAEYDNTVAGTTTVVVTARGFSPDYSESDAGVQTSGSVVWLQSFLRVK